MFKTALIAFCITPFLVVSQNENDLYRHSKTLYHGTARFESMGGSFGALGADLSSYQVNPAGYGRYSSSQGGISFFGGSTNNSTTFNGVNSKSPSGHGGLSNLGLVFANDVSQNGKGFIFNQIGIGYNQIESFKNKITYEGQQFSSLIDDFVGQIQGYYPEELNIYFPFSSDLAYQTDIIEYNTITSEFYSLLNSGDVYHQRTMESKGGVNEVYANFSANYLNKLYIGANLSIRSYRYIEDITHFEELTDTTGTNLRSFEYDYYLKTKGSGGIVRIGMIYLVNESIRFGLALHSPTFSEMTDTWSASMSSTFDTYTKNINDSLIPTGDYKYKVRTPGRIVGSLAFVFGTKGCINIDAEYLSYKHNRFKSTSDLKYEPYNYEYENNYAKQVFQDALNIRLGGEYVVFPGFFLRAGMSYYGNAFQSNQQIELKPELIISGGLGIKTKKLSVDISYRQRSNKTSYYAFSNSLSTIDRSSGSAVITGAFNF
jgi:hypothetical protein